jgi:hypothetical protein
MAGEKCKCKTVAKTVAAAPGKTVETVYVNSDMQTNDVQLGNGWSLGHSTTIPLMRMVESLTPGVGMEAEVVVGFGAGIAFNWTTPNQVGVINKSIVCITPLMVVLSTDTDWENQLGVSVGPVVGFFDNSFQLGCLYNFAKLEVERSRFEVVFSLGPSLLKNLQ